MYVLEKNKILSEFRPWCYKTFLMLNSHEIFRHKFQNKFDQDKLPHLGDNCVQNFHLGRYIVRYTVGNLFLLQPASGAVKCDIRTYIRWHIAPNENFGYGYPILMHFCSLSSLECCKPHKAARHHWRKFWGYPIRRNVSNSSALELGFDVRKPVFRDSKWNSKPVCWAT